jgi:hypothetical protein
LFDPQLSAYLKAVQPSVQTGSAVPIANQAKVGSLYFAIVGVPLWVGSYVGLSARAEILRSTLSVEYFTGFTSTASAEMGMVYGSTTGYDFYRTFDCSFTPTPPSLVTSARGILDGRVYLLPTFSFWVYDLAGNGSARLRSLY